jgi:glutathione synthase/RimK-type ligase-like ATP-grasp enzyme
MRIALHINDSVKTHSTSWVNDWEFYSKKEGINIEILNCFNLYSIKQLKDYDCLLWYFDNYNATDMEFARTYLRIAEKMGLKVFPNIDTIWFYDDKVSQYILLDSISAQIPKSWSFFDRTTTLEWIRKEAIFPIVAKLKSGSGSNNVKLLKNQKEAINYAERMFGKGFENVPSFFLKAKSNIKSSKNFQTYLNRFKRIPEFIETRKRAKKLPREYGYVYLQEFIENDGYDLKVIVVNNKLTFFARPVRDGDFRASGGGKISYDKSLINDKVIKSAFETANKLNLQCVGFDYVIEKGTGNPKIIEMSYNFSHKVAEEAGGYFDEELVWHNESLNVPFEIIKLMKVR